MAVGLIRNPAYQEMADRARMNGQHDLAGMYEVMEKAHRARHGVPSERVTDKDGNIIGYVLRHQHDTKPRQHVGVNPMGVPHDFAPWRVKWWLEADDKADSKPIRRSAAETLYPKHG